ncbi:YaaC family protein [uncultured Nisaea sp.]|uniref:YaaC family protein n=1 Tax=uncultured Nisaea sp. TaxID=538215 RepID=UPI0030EE63D4|tara:strand:+ start:2150 stop:3286 length:1137 start_codon:yes stop_codon:yes gene_type:complete
MKWFDAREGEVVHIRGRPATFSFFPTYQGAKREGVHSILFATEPWNIIQNNLEKLSDANAKRQALAFLVQSRDFFTAAQNSDVSAAKPLLLYYSFLNLAKCLIVKRSGTALSTVRHGLSEQLPVTAGAIHGHVSIDILQNPSVSAFVMFANAIGAALPTPAAPSTHFRMRSQGFLGQVLIGHRIFCQAETIKERFISLDRIEYMQDATAQEAWLRVRAYADDFTRLGYRLNDLSKNLGAAGAWRNVNCSTIIDGRRIIEAETIATTRYGHRPSQVLSQISNDARSQLWRSVTAYPPYRKYYIYIPSPAQTLLSQLLTIYLATFYFGSITRYKPEQFEQILKSPIGPFVFEFFSNQPTQFLYLMASEFMEQEVAKAAIT